MKNLKFSDKDIERLFEKAANQPPIIDDEKVHFLLYHAPQPASSGHSVKHFFKKYLNLIIMSTIISSIFVGVTLLMPAGQHKSPTIKNNAQNFIAKKTYSLNNNRQTTASNGKNGHLTAKTIKEGAHLIIAPDSVIPAKTNTVATTISNKQPETFSKTEPLPEWDGKPASGDDYIMELTSDELKNLGVLLNDSGLYYLNVTPNGIISGYNRPYFWASYESRQIPGFKRKTRYQKDIEKTVSFLPFYLCYSTNEQIINSFNNVSVSYYKELLPFYPQTASPLFYNRWDSTNFTRRFFSTLDSLNENTDRNFLFSMLKLPLKSMDDTLVPVLIRQKYYTDIVYKTRILWFVSNNDFYNALPARYQNVREFYENKKLLKKKYPDANLVDYNKHYEFYDYMENIHYIDLSKEELKKIGIRFLNGETEFDAGIDYRNINNHLFLSKNPDFSTSGGRRNPVKLDVYALFISNFKEKILRKLGLKEPNGDSLKMNELIPVRIKKDLPDGYQLEDDLIFWYAPTEAFFDSLPPRIGNQLKQEYKTIMMRRDPAVPLEVKSKLSSSCTYFEECKATLFDVNIVLMPNPFTDNLNIELQLQQNEKLTISLFSMTGRKIQTLMPFTELQSGQYRFSYPASDINAGMYLLTVQNARGQLKSQRVIKIR
ncbi:MAG: T9SS type A sorting domain-containing protein [Bacteroidota bacterium]|nr:T9SS type A sorting domain-containing protein [Bacteroidota bacterium]